MDRICSVGGCKREAYSRGFCEMHYRRVLRTGDPGPPGTVRQRPLCEVSGCDKPHDAQGLCHGHYLRFSRSGVRDDSPLRKGGTVCSVEGCDRPHKAKGYCAAHYKRVLVHGHPRADVPIREVDGTGTFRNGYLNVYVPRKVRHLTNGISWTGEHRLVMALHLGRPLAPEEVVHHINGVRSDNRPENLELWSTSHPSGKRVEDLLVWCQVMLDRYSEEEWDDAVSWKDTFSGVIGSA